MNGEAVISPCGKYRYALWRRWADSPQVLFVMLNPSTANATDDDPTIRRCIGYAKAWGYGSLAVANLFALRSTDPKVIKRSAAPIGPDNDQWIQKLASESEMAVAAWGAPGTYLKRSEEVAQLIPGFYVLGFTKAGQPLHPLFLRGDLQPYVWKGASQ